MNDATSKLELEYHISEDGEKVYLNEYRRNLSLKNIGDSVRIKIGEISGTITLAEFKDIDKGGSGRVSPIYKFNNVPTINNHPEIRQSKSGETNLVFDSESKTLSGKATIDAIWNDLRDEFFDIL